VRVLDTDTCIELLRGNPEVLSRRAAIQDEVATTWINAAELYFGAARSTAPLPNRALVDEFIETLEVIGLDRPAAQVFGERKAELRAAGETLADADLLIGSIVMARGAILVTGNTGHFARFPGIRLENWIR
jgi:tRNA(fMet)-specific endonuclease VapC